jgi:hypothetical protein
MPAVISARPAALPAALAALSLLVLVGASCSKGVDPLPTSGPWLVPGPCTYTCVGRACDTPCAPDETPGPLPYECCSSNEACVTRSVLPSGITASCPPCPEGWVPAKDGSPLCCDAKERTCYSPSAGMVNQTGEFSSMGCQGSGSNCSCVLQSVDGHTYGIVCAPVGCACTRDGQPVKDLPPLCGAEDGTLDGSYLLWGCGFPPV